MAYVRVGRQNPNNQVVNYDEYQHMAKMRFMTATEAHLRLESYPIIDLSHEVLFICLF